MSAQTKTATSPVASKSIRAAAVNTPRIPGFLQRRIDHYYEHRMAVDWGGRHIMAGSVPKDDDIVLMSNDYLALAQHPEILQAQIDSIQASGNGMLMSAIFLNGPNEHASFESRMADFMQCDTTIVSQSGWNANTGLMQTLADPETPVYIDFFAHVSLWEGVHAAHATAYPFRHNEPGHLARMIAKHGPGVIVVDSVYSTNGSVAPLAEIAEMAERTGCVFVVDESHSLGTHGPHGEGLVVELGLTDKVHFRTASLAKAFAARGGIIAAHADFASYFRSTSSPAIFSSTLLPHELAGMSKTLDVIRAADDRRSRLHEIAAHMRHEIDELGYNLRESEAQIIALEAGSELEVMHLRDVLEANGLFGAIFCPPATPRNRALVRLSLHSAMTDDQVERTLRILAETREESGMWTWGSTRKKRGNQLSQAA
ncbi:MAG: quorum-sensing autoinducer CAI-1 synthase [Gammaproteobacteria bacterium]|nr:quorum-sensing autoinducer CAI-1 synthase [Gammaproteobacteria bacterium]MCP5136884.1 quorum-sensing autoinducer CAI-1 synthase [Gammaproteobacteria bacterium]